jgi:hypothetical protein
MTEPTGEFKSEKEALAAEKMNWPDLPGKDFQFHKMLLEEGLSEAALEEIKVLNFNTVSKKEGRVLASNFNEDDERVGQPGFEIADSYVMEGDVDGRHVVLEVLNPHEERKGTRYSGSIDGQALSPEAAKHFYKFYNLVGEAYQDEIMDYE